VILRYSRSTCVLVVVGEGSLRRGNAKLLGATYPRGMNVRGVDERTSQWESDEPTFRVYLFSGGRSGRSWTTGTYDITDADVVQVLGWAQEQVGPEDLFAVALVSLDAKGELGLTWLTGLDANDADAESREGFTRMRERRGRPVATLT